MNASDTLNANLNALLRLALNDGIVIDCRILSIDDGEHADVFVEIESLVDGVEMPHLLPGTCVRVFIADISRIEKDNQNLFNGVGSDSG